MELDLFWTIKAGQNPVDIFNKYPGRFQLFHMKDMYTNEAPFFTTDGVDDFAPVGEGMIDFKEILAAKKTAGLKYMVVEQDATRDGKPFDAIKTSMTNLTTKYWCNLFWQRRGVNALSLLYLQLIVIMEGQCHAGSLFLL